MPRVRRVGFFAAVLVLSIMVIGGCASDTDESNRDGPEFGGSGDTAIRTPGADGRKCPTNENFIEESTDTSGDNVADVRKVYRVEGEGNDRHKIIVCREFDLNGDGRKDVFRFYNDNGRPLRELIDEDFDGQIDRISYFENGRVIKQEEDRNDDGISDETRYYVQSKLLRVDRDDNYDGHIDVWEHWDQGRLLRMGYDLNRDKVADLWHRAPPRPEDEDDEVGEGGEDEEGESPPALSEGDESSPDE